MQLEDSTFVFYSGRINGMTKDGPWVYFDDDGTQIKQVQLPAPTACVRPWPCCSLCQHSRVGVRPRALASPRRQLTGLRTLQRCCNVVATLQHLCSAVATLRRSFAGGHFLCKLWDIVDIPRANHAATTYLSAVTSREAD